MPYSRGGTEEPQNVNYGFHKVHSALHQVTESRRRMRCRSAAAPPGRASLEDSALRSVRKR